MTDTTETPQQEGSVFVPDEAWEATWRRDIEGVVFADGEIRLPLIVYLKDFTSGEVLGWAIGYRKSEKLLREAVGNAVKRTRRAPVSLLVPNLHEYSGFNLQYRNTWRFESADVPLKGAPQFVEINIFSTPSASGSPPPLPDVEIGQAPMSLEAYAKAVEAMFPHRPA